MTRSPVLATLALLLFGCAQDRSPAFGALPEEDAGQPPWVDRVVQLADAGLDDFDDADTDDDAGLDEPPSPTSDAAAFDDLPDATDIAADADAGVETDAAPTHDASVEPEPASTCAPCTARGDCADDHFCWPVNDSNRCLPLTDMDSYSECDDIGMDGRSLPDGTYFCRPLTGDCDQWLLLYTDP